MHSLTTKSETQNNFYLSNQLTSKIMMTSFQKESSLMINHLITCELLFWSMNYTHHHFKLIFFYGCQELLK